MELLERYGIRPEVAWLGTLVAGVLTIATAAVVFTERVYYGFLWRYFWGPVEADSQGVDCLVYQRTSGDVVPGATAAEGCARVEGVFVAEPGYTVVSTISYILVLVFMLGGVYLLLDRFDLSPYDRFFYALVPFMLFGGALRVVEDSFVAARAAGETPAIEFPASAALISPFIYFTVFFVALSSFLVAKYLAHAEITETFYYPLAGLGVGWLVGTFGYLLYLSRTNDWITLHPSILVIVVGIATASAALVYLGVDRFDPATNAGTGLMGLVVVWGHAVDGIANVLANDWTQLWGLGEYGAKHPFNQAIMDVTSAIQGGPEIGGIYVGTAWPFFFVKLLVPVLILAVFDEEFFEESPRFAVMLLGAIVAVGLGPGTRDMIRVAFGI
ncbi:DUF63 family protein [Halovenus sp. WSH3]|uniref:DUF63 family protein n=1 Tax=Halovenus carboxidivorans TaxID=2692199 RepID=A0A6B0TCV4_9EURY|nr:DUF63 family protein [Halovenus carboxidivorans]MXR51029.1 DUF63 family protein [Halovenus carboxidivorans]